MRIKNFLMFIAFSLFTVFVLPLRSSALGTSATTATASPSDSLTDTRVAAQIVSRVNEIQAMDKTNLTADEKKALRKELNGLKKQAEGLDSKVYLSVGAIIIIILLLILILR